MNMQLRSRTWKRWLIHGWVVVGLFGVSTRAWADNPIVQTNYTADPAPMVYEDRLYVYTSHDEDETVNNFFTMNDWRCYSTVDMVNWTDHGSPLGYQDFSWSSGDAWAGQVIHRDGRFFFYVPLSNRSTGRKVIGVAVSDEPTGPFVDPLGAPLVENSYDIDPTVFIDDDGQAYLYWGNPDLMYVRLNDDMISYDGEIVRVPMTTESFGERTGDAERPTLFEEGPWLYKRDDLYYLLFAAHCCSPEKLDYSTSDSATGPWTYRGRIMDSSGNKSFTNHPGVVEFRGHDYLFYHTGELPGGGGFRRSVAVEEFTYEDDGTIPVIPMTAEGPEPIATLDPFQRTEAETIAFSEGLKTKTSSEGGVNVTSIDDGDYIKVRNVDFGRGIAALEVRVASESSCGTIEVHLDDRTGPLVGTCPIAATGGEDVWQTQTCAMEGATDVHDLYFVFTGGCRLFEFDWWRFSGPGAEPTDDSGSSDEGQVDGGDTQEIPSTTSSTTTDASTGAPIGTSAMGDESTYGECMQRCEPSGSTADPATASDGGGEAGDASSSGSNDTSGGGCSCRTGRDTPALSFLGIGVWLLTTRRRRAGARAANVS